MYLKRSLSEILYNSRYRSGFVCQMFKRVAMLSIVMLIYMVVINEGKKKGKRKTKFGPKAMSFNHSTTCDEFSKNARFNPYSVLFERWFVFYYWDFPQTPKTYLFTFPSSNLTQKLHKVFDGKVTKPVNWTSRLVLMDGPGHDISLLVERGDRGQYWQYYIRRVEKELIKPYDVRLKQTGDGRILGIMNCDRETVFVMSRINEVPPKHRLHEEAARLGFRSRRGKSYLYQGHEWMPIPEADDKDLWLRPEDVLTNNEIKDSESNHSKNVIQEELEQVSFTNESNKSQSIHKLNESHCNNTIEICQSVHMKDHTSNNETSQVTNNFELDVYNNHNMSQLVFKSKENFKNITDNAHSSEEKYSMDNFKDRDLVGDIERVKFTNIKKSIQPSDNLYESTSTTDLKELRTDTSNRFSKKELDFISISENNKQLNDLDIVKNPDVKSAVSVADDMRKILDNISTNKEKSQTENLKYSSNNDKLQSIDDLQFAGTDDPNSPFDPTDFLDLNQQSQNPN